ncbi:MAG: cardiolipin synthase [Christensenella sp.]|uniref:cardiolipin synthase n=1 Tax=Christensenella sp. TaxID=1935934 RepID=UPI002B220680|nr:cardiolipin synthase [Christensenella sp.]MEA5003878.1 cardiolipin synthase [Christensenella sp.]
MKKILSFFTSRLFIVFALIAVQALIIISVFYYFDEESEILQNIFFVLSLIMALYIVNKRQNASYKLAWIIPVLVLPLLGILLYVFFSQRKITKKMRQKAKEIYEKTSCLLEQDAQVLGRLEEQDLSAMRQADYIRRSNMFPVWEKTQTQYFPSGETFFEQLKAELEKAERYIFMEYFIVQEGVMWNSILDILKRKADEGLDVRFMYDDMGCARTLPFQYYKKLRGMGIKCIVFNTLKPELSSIFNNRDHRKITVIDGHTAFCGGANLADEYINEIEKFGHWKDASVMLKGDGAWSFAMMFLQAWDFMVGEENNCGAFLPEPRYVENYQTDGFVQPYCNDPMDDEYISENVYLNMITRAEKYLYINTPYLILDNELMAALTNAAKSGVDVRITTPHIPDKKMVFMLTRAYYEQLLEAGVRIYEYTPGFIHSKTFVCDDKMAIVGTINLDYRSLFLHYECGVWMYGTSSVMAVKEDYMNTMPLCGEVEYEEIRRRKWYVRLMQAVLRVFAPLM